jgi:hypothetical protein
MNLRLFAALGLLAASVHPVIASDAVGAGGIPVLSDTTATPTEIPPGKLRSALFDLARPSIEAEAGQAVKFQGSLKRVGDWAFFRGVIVDAKGREIKVGEAESADTCALWRKSGESWKLIQAATGFTDVIYLDYADKYGAPAALFE